MNLTETANLLRVLHNVDNRKVDEATVVVWQKILGEFTADDCLTAAIRHFRDSREYLMPAHIADGARELARQRIRDDNTRKAAAAIEAQQAIDTGPLTSRSQEIQDFVGTIRDGLPDGNPDALRYGHREWREHAERRKRQDTAQPNPHYDPTAIKRLEEMSGDDENP